jgi:hypothetical protein
MNLYRELLDKFYEVKGKDIANFTKDKDLESLLNSLSVCVEIKDAYDIDLTNKNVFKNFNVYNINKFNASISMSSGDGYIGLFSEIYNSDKQPKGEQMLLKISHPTGAYIFGDYYPSGFFNKFFQELQERTKVEYVDSLNNSLYYTLENAMESLRLYKEIYAKYSKNNEENYKIEMIRRKKEELERLESQLKGGI